MRRFKPSKSHCQMYSNGKLTVNGAKSVAEARELVRKYTNILRHLGYLSDAPTDFRIVNIVATGNLSRLANLPVIASNMIVPCQYEPEIFPGIVIKLSECTAVLFSSGKYNLLGAKDEMAVHSSALELELLT